MKKAQWRGKKNAISWIDKRNITKRGERHHKDVVRIIANQTRKIGSSTVRRRDTDSIDITFTICDLEPLLLNTTIPGLLKDVSDDIEQIK